ncbi:putative transcription factor MYB-HB-like family [Medicago truncatula]|uniref:Putative transcription factor MYB-HB-like family n=1 Tax=Medicago truncatula TaxID=3880 RepID=A0A396IIU3_MEDTR|nr:putative transcription factor MYB-HB-like family [Medicago truncatula]
MSSSSDTNKGLKKGKWSKEEDEMLKAYVEKHGTRNWNGTRYQEMRGLYVALPGRSDNDIKNFWNARKRKLEKRMSPFPDKMELNDELNKSGSNSQQVKDSQDDEFNIPQVKFTYGYGIRSASTPTMFIPSISFT